MLAVHAASCGDTNEASQSVMDVQDTNNTDRSLQVTLNKIRSKIDEKTETPWNIKVVRRLFNSTSMEQLEEAEAEDWNRTIKVEFIGEEGVDAGGLLREFFTLLFQGTKVFEGNTFSHNPELLAKKQYCLIGKAVAAAILSGHPGPRCLNRHVTTYILEGKEPDFIHSEDIQRAYIKAAIKRIEDATPEDIENVFNETISLLQETGYSHTLTLANKGQAVTALKGHFLLYRGMAAINQFMEGLNLHDVLKLLQHHPKEAAEYFCEDKHPTADEVASFYKPSFSSDADKKALEEVIMYNWNKFLKKIEKGRISSPWINVDEGDEQDVTINMGHVLQALLGCSRLAKNIGCGVIEFEHSSCNLPKVNTCAPSISFSKTKDLQSYDIFENIMLYIIVGSYGFGSA